MTDPQPTPARRNVFARMRTVADRVPTRWFTGILTGVFLAVTAAFGGLATAAEPQIGVLASGEEHRSDQLALTIERAVLLDEFPEAGVYVEDGERVLAIQIRAENLWTEPLWATAGSSVGAVVQVDELDGVAPDSIARYDDATTSPWLQPHVPATLVLTWAIDAAALSDGQQLHLTIRDNSLYTGSFVIFGQSWQDPVPVAISTIAVTDLGAGAATEDDKEEGAVE